jgi:tRNA(fMet)-specific endonuclease VapC
MRIRYMLDTDMCSYLIKGTSDELAGKVKRHRNQLCMSTITLAELLFGAAKKNYPRLSEAVALMQQLVMVIPWTTDAARQYAVIRSELESVGTPIGNMDMLIAAAATSENCCLITNNTAHFSRVGNLRLENWLHGK